MNKFILGGWSQSLSSKPLEEFDVMMYGMVTNLDGLTTGTPASPGWSPEKQYKPDNTPDFKGKTLWVYGGGGCSLKENLQIRMKYCGLLKPQKAGAGMAWTLMMNAI